jgi:hypothetical protein
VIGMTFVERQRRALSEIECMLRRTDPCLASKFGMFSRLAVDEGMPSAEQVISGRARRRSGMTRVGQLPCRLRELLCMAAAAAAIMAGLLLAGAGGSRALHAGEGSANLFTAIERCGNMRGELGRATAGGLRAWP